MEGISLVEAKHLLYAVQNAPRWLLENGSTELGIVIAKQQGDLARKLHIIPQILMPSGATQIIAAVNDTVVLRDGTLRKVTKVHRDACGGATYNLEYLQHWQVPQPCDKRLGWSLAYSNIARCLAADDGRATDFRKARDADFRKVEENARAKEALQNVSAASITLAGDDVTFDDIKRLIVEPLSKKERAKQIALAVLSDTEASTIVTSTIVEPLGKTQGSLSYTHLLGDTEASTSASAEIQAPGDDGKGLHSRRSRIFFSWSFAQRFDDFVEAFEAFLNDELDPCTTGAAQGRMYAWVSPLSIDQLNAEDFDPTDWAIKFQELVKTIGSDKHGTPGKGMGTVLLFTPINDPAPMKRMWCIWEMYVTKQSKSRLTVQIPPRYVSPRNASIVPRIKSMRAKAKPGGGAALIRRVVEAEMTHSIEKNDYQSIDEFVQESFKKAAAKSAYPLLPVALPVCAPPLLVCAQLLQPDPVVPASVVGARDD